MMNPAEILSATIHHGQEKIKRPFLEKAVLGFDHWRTGIKLGFIKLTTAAARFIESLVAVNLVTRIQINAPMPTSSWPAYRIPVR